MVEEQIQYVPLNQVTCDPQVRKEFDEAAIRGLAQSIREVGIQLPIRVRRGDGNFVVIDGERRLRAAQLVNLPSVPVIVAEHELEQADVIQRQLILNCQRQALQPIESALAVQRLMKETGWSATQVAAKLGFSNAKVTRLLSLTALPSEIQDKVARGVIAASAAYELSRVGNPHDQAEFARKVEAGELARDAIRGAAKGGKKRQVASKPKVARVTATVTDGFSVTVKPSILTLDALIRALDELVAKARKARPQGLQLDAFVKTLREPASA